MKKYFQTFEKSHFENRQVWIERWTKVDFSGPKRFRLHFSYSDSWVLPEFTAGVTNPQKTRFHGSASVSVGSCFVFQRKMFNSDHWRTARSLNGAKISRQFHLRIPPQFFQDLGNAHYCDTEIRKNRGFIRNTTAGCDGCENLPEYHCLLLADVRNTFVANCLYTLVKPKRGRLEWLLRIFYSKSTRFLKIATQGGLIETIRRALRVLYRAFKRNGFLNGGGA